MSKERKRIPDERIARFGQIPPELDEDPADKAERELDDASEAATDEMIWQKKLKPGGIDHPEERETGWSPPPKEFDAILPRDYNPLVFTEHVRFICDIARKLRSEIEMLEENVPDLELSMHGRSVLGRIQTIINDACARWDKKLQPTIDGIYRDRMKKGLGED